MKTIRTPYAIPVAMLLASALLAGPTAQAEPSARTFEVRFSYNHDDGADRIYANLQRTARKACNNIGMRSLRMHQQARVCAAGVVENGVNAIGRTDLAALHYGRRMTQIAGAR